VYFVPAWLVDGVAANRCENSPAIHRWENGTPNKPSLAGTKETALSSLTGLFLYPTANPAMNRRAMVKAASSTNRTGTAASSVKDAAWAVEDATFSIEDATFSIEDATFSIEDATFSIEDVTLSIEDATSSIEDATFSIEDATSSIEDAMSSIEDAAFSIEDAAFSIESARPEIVENVETACCATKTTTFGALALPLGAQAPIHQKNTTQTNRPTWHHQTPPGTARTPRAILCAGGPKA
jgi:hypothetical protein